MLNLNTGIIQVSEFKTGWPTVVCGDGRGGTTSIVQALGATGIAAEGWETPGGESREGQLAWTSEPKALEFYRINTAKRLGDPEFVHKFPTAERIASQDGKKNSAWGGNYIIVTRDPIAGAVREASVNEVDVIDRAIVRSLYIAASMSAAITLGRSSGVIVVSYEKLLTATTDVIQGVLTWMKKTGDVEAGKRIVIPNNEIYRSAKK